MNRSRELVQNLLAILGLVFASAQIGLAAVLLWQSLGMRHLGPLFDGRGFMVFRFIHLLPAFLVAALTGALAAHCLNTKPLLGYGLLLSVLLALYQYSGFIQQPNPHPDRRWVDVVSAGAIGAACAIGLAASFLRKRNAGDV